ncbi:AraC family transcriptional regulator [Actinocrinis puniceicyclus]|uniref:AraC family transcriptional regulator n=1 Tax=Actinocrinis puniceicyclus TaxID=977794 RepID=A0A8J7WPX4_9ACTN|nr:AraC family transcriptional regulator [Actinocrinis puniceicyclus]MBS2964197.1 AraC family transcriptional regulator [Actinocrinis puniceicyclus]
MTEPMGFTRWAAAHHVRAALVGARRRGVDVAPLLERAGIEEHALADEHGRVPAAQFVALTKALWSALDDELLGLCSAPLRLGTFAMMTHAVVHCSPDLRTAVRRADRFYRLFPAGPRFSLTERDSVARVEFDLSDYDDPDRFAAESLLIVWHRSASWLIRRRIGLDEVELGYPAPPHALEYGLLYGTTCRFGAAATAVSFDRALLDQPVVQDEAALRAFLRRAPWDILARMDYGQEVSAQVRRLLNQALGAGAEAPLPGPEQVAARLAVSPQTLRRRLSAERTSFQQVRDQLRRDVAVSALARGDTSIEELSARLGFSEPSAFHRAFRRWTGATPRSYQGSYQEANRDATASGRQASRSA